MFSDCGFGTCGLFVCFLFNSSVAHTSVVVDHRKIFPACRDGSTWNLDLELLVEWARGRWIENIHIQWAAMVCQELYYMFRNSSYPFCSGENKGLEQSSDLPKVTLLWSEPRSTWLLSSNPFCCITRKGQANFIWRLFAPHLLGMCLFFHINRRSVRCTGS